MDRGEYEGRQTVSLSGSVATWWWLVIDRSVTCHPLETLVFARKTRCKPFVHKHLQRASCPPEPKVRGSTPLGDAILSLVTSKTYDFPVLAARPRTIALHPTRPKLSATPSCGPTARPACSRRNRTAASRTLRSFPATGTTRTPTAARAILGHRSLGITDTYAELDQALAVEAARKLG